MRSTYDRAGFNYDGSQFIRKTGSGYVTLDVAGSGAVTFFRANHWHGSPWMLESDDSPFVLGETNTADPDHPVTPAFLGPSAPFPEPFSLLWPVTQGADVLWTPMPFSRSFQIRYGRVHYGTGYYIYSLYPEGATNLSRTPCTWDRVPPTAADAALLATTAEDIAPRVGTTTAAGVVDVPASGLVEVARVVDGPGTIRALSFDVDAAAARALAAASLRITWDDRALPSVDAPLGLFFGAGSLYNRNSVEYLVRAFPTTIHFVGGRVRFTTIFPMPYARSARVQIVGAGTAAPGVAFTIRRERSTAPPGFMGYFHATYRDHGTPTPGRDLVFLDTKVDEGGGAWCGSFVGTSFILTDRANLVTLEGDPRFFFDDSGTPQAQGTGTEEWGAGGDYWLAGHVTTLPLAGHPVGAPTPADAASAEDEINSAYRYLLADAMPFGQNARIQFEHGGADDAPEHYRSVTYWYGLPDACLTLADSFHVGDVADETAHGWSAVGASDPASLTSEYELGIDASPATTDTGRTVQGSSTFRIVLPASNLGVLLRRKLDYAIPNQRAEVSIADDRDDAPFVRAGTWYLAGSTTWLNSDTPDETGAGSDLPVTSPRRWRDDEFLVPRALTAGRSAVRVRLGVVPSTVPLMPGLPPPETGWSAFRYWAYAYKMPQPP